MSDETFDSAPSPDTGDQASRAMVPALDEILGTRFQVLDDGFIRLIDYMGSDASIVQAARVSYGAGTKRVREDRGLIRYLMRHGHTTPFEMCEVKLHVRVPMDTWRQWIRHRTANVNEYSTRYSVAIDAAQRTEPNAWRNQSEVNRQGSSSTLQGDTGARFSEREVELQDLSRSVYEERIAAGIAREQARKDLPLSTYTEAYWKIDLHNLFHFLRLRMDSHAQQEIRSYAQVIGEEIVARWVPIAWQAFLDYKLNSVQLSQGEVQVLAEMLIGDPLTARQKAVSRGLLREGGSSSIPTREGAEFTEKLRRMGIVTPWE